MATTWIERIGFYDKGQSRKARVLLFGDAGTGKTRLAGGFPSPFFIDTDKGGKTLESLHIPFIALEREGKIFDTCMEIMRALKASQPPFNELGIRTLVFDSLTSLADMLVVEAMRTVGKIALDPNRVKVDWDTYSVLQARLKSIIKFSQDLDVNIVATCGTKLEKDDILGSFVGKPNIIGGYRDTVIYDFDDCLYLTVEGMGASQKYKAYTSRHSYYEAKTRSGLAPVYEDPSFEKLYGKT